MSELKPITLPTESAAQKMIGYVVETTEDGSGLCWLDVRSDHINRIGVVHGGIVSVLLDSASGTVARASLNPDMSQAVATVSLTVNFAASAREGRITARGRVTGGGRKLIFVDAVLQDEAGTVLATSTGVFKRLSKPNN
ncbi:MAG: PaaI family thioesterase [Rhodobacteraceae bacterium]|nr:PaaI family thioesterase [Paracoccaceae bacterium]